MPRESRESIDVETQWRIHAAKRLAVRGAFVILIGFIVYAIADYFYAVAPTYEALLGATYIYMVSRVLLGIGFLLAITGLVRAR